MSRILIVDDEEMILKALKRFLTCVPCVIDGVERKLFVDTFLSPQKALQHASHVAYDLVISDYRMPIMNGVEFLREFREIQPETSRMILSGYADLNGLIEAINSAAICRFIAKPWNDYELISAIGAQLKLRDIGLENRRLADEARLATNTITAEEIERRRLELEEPGITRVNWGPDGSVLLDNFE